MNPDTAAAYLMFVVALVMTAWGIAKHKGWI